MKNYVLVFALFTSLVTKAQLPTYYIQHTSANVSIDGDLSEWTNIAETPNFVENYGIVPSDINKRNTVKAKMMWDDNNLYIAYTVSDKELLSTVLTQDGTIFNSDDIAEMIFDFDGAGAPYLEMGVSASNVNYDYAIFCAGEDGCGSWSDNLVWDIAGFQSAVVVNGSINASGTDQGYTMEIKLPFAGLSTMPQGNFTTPVNNTTWKGNLMALNFNSGDASGQPSEYLSYSPNTATQSPNNHLHNYFASFVFKTGNVEVDELSTPSFYIQTITNVDLQVNTSSMTNVLIYDVLGNVILKNVVSENTAYSLADLAAGCYIFQVNNGSSRETKKIIVQ
jgi:hypothetical protein